jgi:hypothetical protein
MTTLPPCHLLKSKVKDASEGRVMEPTVVWTKPPSLILEKNVKYYRDLLKSTEKVELTLSHSGKKETFECGESPSEPLKSSSSNNVKHSTILVPVRTDNDPRTAYILGNGDVDTRPEYKDNETLTSILVRRGQTATPTGSKSVTPVGSPKNISRSPSLVAKKPPPPPPPANRPPPPPPPKAPPEKRVRQF